jgi:uncharacterized lipoprotein YajG
MLRGLAITVFVALATGCTFNPQTINITPHPTILTSNEGQGVAVAVRVIDERPSKAFGRRNAGIASGLAGGAGGGEITTLQDISAVVGDQVRVALQKRGFRPTEYHDNHPVCLTVELRSLDYSTSIGWTLGVHSRGSAKAIGKRGADVYEKMYRSESEERAIMMRLDTTEANEALINAALDDLLTQIFADDALFRFLGK